MAGRPPPSPPDSGDPPKGGGKTNNVNFHDFTVANGGTANGVVYNFANDGIKTVEQLAAALKDVASNSRATSERINIIREKLDDTSKILRAISNLIEDDAKVEGIDLFAPDTPKNGHGEDDSEPNDVEESKVAKLPGFTHLREALEECVVVFNSMSEEVTHGNGSLSVESVRIMELKIGNKQTALQLYLQLFISHITKNDSLYMKKEFMDLATKNRAYVLLLTNILEQIKNLQPQPAAPTTHQPKKIRKAKPSDLSPNSKFSNAEPSWNVVVRNTMHFSTEEFFLKVLAQVSRRVKKNRTLQDEYNALKSPMQRNQVDRLVKDKNEVLKREFPQLEWKLAGLESVVRNTGIFTEETKRIKVILKTQWVPGVEVVGDRGGGGGGGGNRLGGGGEPLSGGYHRGGPGRPPLSPLGDGHVHPVGYPNLNPFGPSVGGTYYPREYQYQPHNGFRKETDYTGYHTYDFMPRTPPYNASPDFFEEHYRPCRSNRRHNSPIRRERYHSKSRESASWYEPGPPPHHPQSYYHTPASYAEYIPQTSNPFVGISSSHYGPPPSHPHPNPVFDHPSRPPPPPPTYTPNMPLGPRNEIIYESFSSALSRVRAEVTSEIEEIVVDSLLASWTEPADRKGKRRADSFTRERSRDTSYGRDWAMGRDIRPSLPYPSREYRPEYGYRLAPGYHGEPHFDSRYQSRPDYYPEGQYYSDRSHYRRSKSPLRYDSYDGGGYSSESDYDDIRRRMKKEFVDARARKALKEREMWERERERKHKEYLDRQRWEREMFERDLRERDRRDRLERMERMERDLRTSARRSNDADEHIEIRPEGGVRRTQYDSFYEEWRRERPERERVVRGESSRTQRMPERHDGRGDYGLIRVTDDLLGGDSESEASRDKDHPRERGYPREREYPGEREHTRERVPREREYQREREYPRDRDNRGERSGPSYYIERDIGRNNLHEHM
ncbi:hypothetical protein HYALB_00008112 [Hymenoscyphus albidus]|uniref:Uncharacterized protein n=1 Tax=Hymenoscyphus albidus TaxID=595503 RepID=A0A9N9Q7C7_9HELO|nr:hypothetical protein HYALB_00008112 [Hymenoscyphus albidus]